MHFSFNRGVIQMRKRKTFRKGMALFVSLVILFGMTCSGVPTFAGETEVDPVETVQAADLNEDLVAQDDNSAVMDQSSAEASIDDAGDTGDPVPEEPIQEAPQLEEPQPEAPQQEASQPEEPQPEAPQPEGPQQEAPQLEGLQSAAPQLEAPKRDDLKLEVPQLEAPKLDEPRVAAEDLATQGVDKLADDGYVPARRIEHIKPATSFSIPMLTGKAGISKNANPVIETDHPTQPGEVMLFKEAKPVPGMVNTWDITLRIEGKDSPKTSDVVLVIDTSTSMEGTRIEAAKNAAIDFVEALLPSDTVRIGVINFDEDQYLVHQLSNDKASLITAIESLSVLQDRGTFTQAGIKRASIMLTDANNPPADSRHIVLLSDGQPTYSYKLDDPDSYLIPYGDDKETSTGAPSTAYTNTRVGGGSTLRTKYGSVSGYWEGWKWVPGYDKYYNHGNSAIAEAGYAKNSFYRVWAVALEVNKIGQGILQQIASPDSYYTANSADIGDVFTEIAGEIGWTVNDASVSDSMGVGFHVSGGVSSIEASQGTFSYNESSKVIEWDPGTLMTSLSGPPPTDYKTIRYAWLKYRVEINDDILKVTPVPSEPFENGLYPTNGRAQIIYIDADGQSQTGDFPIPMVNPVLYKIVKVLQDKDGIDITETAARNFSVRVTGPGTNGPNTVRNFSLNTGTQSSTKLMTDLRDGESTYTFEETGDLTDYEVAYFVNGVPSTDRQFTIDDNDTADVEVKVVNKEKPLKLNVNKNWENVAQANWPNITFTVWRSTDGVNFTQYGGDHVLVAPATTFANDILVPRLNDSGIRYIYQIRESFVGMDDYTRTYTPPMNFATDETVYFNFTNTYKYKDVVANKVWNRGNDPLPLSDIYFKLFRKIASQDHPVAVPEDIAPIKKVPAAEPFEVSWLGMDKYDGNGNEYIYSVKEYIEVEVDEVLTKVPGAPVNYVKVENGLTVTNTYQEPPAANNKTYVVVEKKWENVPAGTTPSATFELYDADNPATVLRTGSITYPNTTYVFNELPLLKTVDGNQVKINYQVREIAPEGYIAKPGGKKESNISRIERTTSCNSTEWNLGYTPSFIVTKPTGNQPYIIWTLNTVLESQRAAFLTEFKTKAQELGANLGPFDNISITDPIVWIAGPNVTYDVYPADPNSGLVKINIVYNADGTISNNSTIEFQKPSTWTQFIVGEHSAVQFDFTNIYIQPTSTVISVIKDLQGRNWLPGETFSFKLTGTVDNQPVNLSVVASAGGVSCPFDAITFTKVGTYTFTVSEVNDGKGGITYPSDQQVVVTVTLNNNTGVLTATANPSTLTFVNKYVPADGAATIAGTKKLTGRTLADGEFTFELYDSNEDGEIAADADPLKVTTNASGKFSFSLTYKDGEEGTYYYAVKEKVGSLGGVTYDTSVFVYKVVVTDPGTGKLDVAVVAPSDTEFNNSYVPADGAATIAGTKKLTGRTLADGEFTFELYACDAEGKIADGAVALDSTTNASGKFSFTLTYKDGQEGTYYYAVKEKDEGLGGVSYDTSVFVYKVEVTDDGAGKLVAKVSAPADTEFNNEYAADDATATISGTKELTGRALKDGEFTFELYACDAEGKIADGAVALDSTTNASGKFSFTLTYKDGQEGTYYYAVKEKDEGLGGVSYDTSVFVYKVEVTDDGAGKLVAKVSAPADTEFNNSYAASGDWTAKVTKALEGRDLAADEFSFQLKDSDGKVLQTKKNAVDGDVTFDPIAYTEKDAGKTYTYTIVEALPDAPECGMEYDLMVVTITVTVEDAGDGTLKVTPVYSDDTEFNNNYDPEKVNVFGKKNWDDNYDQDGKRPESITIRLFADGVEIDHKVVTEADGWVWGFTDLMKYDDWVEIEYSVKEDPVPGYDTSIDGYNVTNTHEPSKISIDVLKRWMDNDDEAGLRPESITIRLFADNVDTGKMLVLTEDVDWAGTFSDLDEYKDGEKIVYTVKEDEFDSRYDSEVEGNADEGFVVWNSLVLDATIVNVNVTKEWVDNNNEAGLRPESITIRLFADGVDTGKSLVLTEKVGWKGEFPGLNKYKNGVEIKYSVKEDEVDRYDSEIISDNGLDFLIRNCPVLDDVVPKTGESIGTCWMLGIGLMMAGAGTLLLIEIRRRKAARKS